MRMAKTAVATALMLVAGVAHAGDSAEMVLDLRTGPRASGGDETLLFSSLWDGDEEATVTIAQDGTALAANLTGEGERAWSVPYNGTYELTHVTYTNGVAGKVETAKFVVTGKAEPPEITNVVATPSCAIVTVASAPPSHRDEKASVSSPPLARGPVRKSSTIFAESPACATPATTIRASVNPWTGRTDRP